MLEKFVLLEGGALVSAYLGTRLISCMNHSAVLKRPSDPAAGGEEKGRRKRKSQRCQRHLCAMAVSLHPSRGTDPGASQQVASAQSR